MNAIYRPRGQYLWDFWLYREQGDYHLFYLQADASLTPRQRHRHSSIGHAVSRDLCNWTEKDCALQAADDPAQWDSVSLWTGCTIKKDGRYYMFYTARCQEDVADDGYVGHTQRIGLAASDDLLSWEKYAANPVLTADYRYYESVTEAHNKHEGWRDPFVVKDETSEWYYAFFTARDRQRSDPKARGCIGRARSKDLLHWETLPPAASPGLFTDMEVPSLHWHQGKWYMLFAVKEEWYSEAYRQAIAPELPQTGVLYLAAESLDGEFTLPESHPVLSGTERRQYTGRIIAAPNGEFVFLSWNAGIDEGAPDRPAAYSLGEAMVVSHQYGRLRLTKKYGAEK